MTVPKKTHIAIWIFIVLQCLLIPLFLGVDVPYRDEWDSIIKSLVLRESDSFHFGQLFLPVVEHRLPLPMGVFQILSLPRYYPKLLMIITAAFHAVGWYFFTKSLSSETQYKNKFVSPYLMILSAVIFFHFAQITNYTMGVQLFWMLGPVGTLIFIYGLLRRSLPFSILGHLVACFSFPAWPLHFILFVAVLLKDAYHTRKIDKSRFTLILGTLIILVGIVTLGFLYNGAGPGLQIKPLKILQFAIFVLASPFSRYKIELAWIFGPIFLLLWSFNLYRGTKFVPGKAFFLYGILAIAASLLIAYGRHVYDESYAFGGHYLLLTVPAWCVVLVETIAKIPSQKKNNAACVFITLYVLIIGTRSAYKELKQSLPMKIKAQKCIAERSERSEDCREAMEYIFLNGFDEKFLLVEKARDLGIYPTLTE